MFSHWATLWSSKTRMQLDVITALETTKWAGQTCVSSSTSKGTCHNASGSYWCKLEWINLSKSTEDAQHWTATAGSNIQLSASESGIGAPFHSRQHSCCVVINHKKTMFFEDVFNTYTAINMPIMMGELATYHDCEPEQIPGSCTSRII